MPGSSSKSMLRRLKIHEGKLVETDDKGASILVFIDPDDEEQRCLIEEFQIDRHTLTSALDPQELGRVEFEPNHAAVIIKRPKQYCYADNFLFKISSVGMFLFSDKLVIVVAENTLHFEGKHFSHIRSLSDVILKVVHRSIVHFEEHLGVFNMIADQLEEKINTAMENRHLLNLFTLEKSLVYYLNAISSNRRVIDKLKAHAQRLGLTAENVEFLDDLLIENDQCHEMAQTYSQVLASLVGARASLVSNNLNVLMKTLTLVMIALMLPTLVVSIFSMNVKLPIEQEEGLLSFGIVMALASASGVAVIWLWRCKKW
jgi:magnesium transporter